MIQTAKRKARGFRLFKSFRTAIYLVGGRLKLACPKPFQVYYAKSFRQEPRQVLSDHSLTVFSLSRAPLAPVSGFTLDGENPVSVSVTKT